MSMALIFYLGVIDGEEVYREDSFILSQKQVNLDDIK